MEKGKMIENFNAMYIDLWFVQYVSMYPYKDPIIIVLIQMLSSCKM
jgi:hypothetical protein